MLFEGNHLSLEFVRDVMTVEPIVDKARAFVGGPRRTLPIEVGNRG